MTEARRFFDEHGWLVVRAAVVPELIVELERAFDQVFPPLLLRHAQPQQVFQILGAGEKFPAVAAWLRHEALARRAAELLGSSRVQLLQDTFLCKPARIGGTVDWHQDYTYTGYLDPPSSLSVRLALSACTVESGCLQVLDGSHRWGWQGRPRILNDDRVRDALDQLPPELRLRVDGAKRTLELEPGDLTLHHCLTIHSSLPNQSEQPRKSIIAHVFDSDCRLIRERLPSGAESRFVTDADGRLIEPDFPTLWRA